MSTTLIVVDMQEDFEASNEPAVVAGVCNQIFLAKQRRSGIVFLEYAGSERTHPGLLELVKGYPFVARAWKSNDDGSMEALREIRKRGFNESRLRVCGVNACYCVKDTAYGLLGRSNAIVEIAAGACSCTCSDNCWDGFDDKVRIFT